MSTLMPEAPCFPGEPCSGHSLIPGRGDHPLQPAQCPHGALGPPPGGSHTHTTTLQTCSRDLLQRLIKRTV